MFSHVMVGVKDLKASKKFYDAVLGALGLPPGVANNQRYFYRSPSGSFGITTPINGEAATVDNGGTIGFKASSPEQAEAFHHAGIAHGLQAKHQKPPRWYGTAHAPLRAWRCEAPQVKASVITKL